MSHHSPDQSRPLMMAWFCGVVHNNAYVVVCMIFTTNKVATDIMPIFRLENWDIILSHLLKTQEESQHLDFVHQGFYSVFKCLPWNLVTLHLSWPTVLVNALLLWQSTTHWIIVSRRGYLETEKSKSILPTSEGDWCSIMTWQRHRLTWRRQKLEPW